MLSPGRPFQKHPEACHSCENAPFAVCPVVSVATAVWVLFLIRPEPPSRPLGRDAHPPRLGAAGSVLTPRSHTLLCRQPAGCRVPVPEVLLGAPGAPAQPRRRRLAQSPLTQCAEVVLVLNNRVTKSSLWR